MPSAGISLDSKARPGAPGQFQYAGGIGIMSPYYPELESKTGRKVVTGENYLPPSKSKKSLKA